MKSNVFWHMIGYSLSFYAKMHLLTLYRDKERSNQMSPPLKLMGMDK